MKKILFAAMLLMVGLAGKVSAQDNATTDYFVGKWHLVIEGAPDGTAVFDAVFERKDGKLTGWMTDEKGVKTTFTNVEEVKNQSVTAYFTANGYEVFMLLEKAGADEVTGTVMDMFEISKGTRVK
jgi:hypothetical protein